MKNSWQGRQHFDTAHPPILTPTQLLGLTIRIMARQTLDPNKVINYQLLEFHLKTTLGL